MASGQDELLFGRLAVHYKLITASQLDEVHGLHALAGGRRQLPEILVEMGYLTQHQVEQLAVVQRDYLEKKRQQTAQAEAAQRAATAAANELPRAAPPPADIQPPRGARSISGHQVAVQADGSLGPAITAHSGSALPSLGGFESGTPAARPALNAPTAPTSPIASSGPVVPTGPGIPSAQPPAAGSPHASLSASPAANWRNAGAHGKRALDAVLLQALGRKASDVHLHCGAPISVRVNGQLENLEDSPLIQREAVGMIEGVLNEEQRAALAERGQVDFAYALPDGARFRANAYRQQRGLDAVLRAIPSRPPTLASLGLPEALARLADFHQGLVLITGPSGSGKSSTMAAIVNLVNESRADHIITIEDPVEYLHPSQRCVVNQRQVGLHTESFARAVRAALREDPDVIAIGEMRDLETIALAITAAETGHLVLGTLHTNNAIRTVNRILGVFPPNQQEQMRAMLSESLRAVVSQRLLRRADGNGRVPALEILYGNKAVANLIRENKTFQIRSILQTGTSKGMLQMEASLADLVKRRIVTRDEAALHSEEPAKLPPA